MIKLKTIEQCRKDTLKIIKKELKNYNSFQLDIESNIVGERTVTLKLRKVGK